jgi:hypothetical protein
MNNLSQMPLEKWTLPTPYPITNVPQAKVGDVVQSLINDDQVAELQVKQQTDGKFILTPKKVMAYPPFNQGKT